MNKRMKMSTDLLMQAADYDDEQFDRWLERADTATYQHGIAPRRKSSTPAPITPRCHTTHPELAFGNGVIVGASCHDPRPGFDIYVGFDYAATDVMRQPWDPVNLKDPIRAMFKIQDMGVPKDIPAFKRMVAWLADQLKAGKRIHIGCIGGHGRTGMVLAAVHYLMTGDKDAILWVRTNHCAKAVETTEQVRFLHTHFGITQAQASKTSSAWDSGTFAGRYGPTGYVSHKSTHSHSRGSKGKASTPSLIPFDPDESAEVLKPLPGGLTLIKP